MHLRKIEEKDLAIRVKWMNNPLIYTTMHYDLPVLLENTKLWFEKNKNVESRIDLVFEDGNDVVAMGGLTSKDSKVLKAELYIFVSPDCQGKGYGTKAIKLLCQYGFERFGLQKIYLYTDSDNLSAKHLYEKVGFKQEGYLRCEAWHAGKIVDRYYFGMLKNEFNFD